MPRTYSMRVGSPRYDPAPAEQFAGDPGEGNYYIGWALGPNGNLTIDAVRTNNPGWPGDSKVSVIHDYLPSTSTQLISHSRMQGVIDEGDFIVSVSFKATNWSHSQILAGNADTAIANTIAYIKSMAPWPFWLCFHHEPENDGWTSVQITTFRAATRYIVQKFRDANVTNVVWMPIYMLPYTFRSGSGRDWRVYHPDYAGSGAWQSDIMMDVFGGDTYLPVPGSSNSDTLVTMFEDAFTAYGSIPGVQESPTPAAIWNKGFIIPEFGMSNQMDPNPNWVTIGTQSRDYAKAEGIKAFFYWDNSPDIGRWSFGTSNYPGQVGTPGDECFDPDGTKKQGWDIIVDGAIRWVAP